MRAFTRFGGAVFAAALIVAPPAVCRAATSDAWITAKTKLSLMTTEGVSGSKINVDTVNGQVTLHGKVPTADEKAKAEQVARGIEGAKGVRNLLQVVPERREDMVKASDSELKDRVAKAIKDDKALADSSIAVQSVNNGVVLLGGNAKTMSDHLRAVEDASQVPGVRRVSSEIKSPDKFADEEIWREHDEAKANAGERGVGQAATDTYITSMTKLRLMADSRTPGTPVNVDTRNGVVTLFGTVPTREAKMAAEEDAKKVSGVKKVTNALEVVPEARKEAVKAKDDDVEKSVERAISESDNLRDASIEVEVENGVARLTGTVPNPEQRIQAAAIARSTAGVKAIKDDLRIERN
jgi:osmotically-inducible protein OsmY